MASSPMNRTQILDYFASLKEDELFNTFEKASGGPAQLWPEFEDRWRLMDPKTEDLLPNGNCLKPGMKVLTADPSMMCDLKNLERPGQLVLAMERNRWCTVSDIEFQQNGVYVDFVGNYDDGSKHKFNDWNLQKAWYVKLDSLPTAVVEVPGQDEYVAGVRREIEEILRELVKLTRSLTYGRTMDDSEHAALVDAATEKLMAQLDFSDYAEKYENVRALVENALDIPLLSRREERSKHIEKTVRNILAVFEYAPDEDEFAIVRHIADILKVMFAQCNDGKERYLTTGPIGIARDQILDTLKTEGVDSRELMKMLRTALRIDLKIHQDRSIAEVFNEQAFEHAEKIVDHFA